MYGITNATDKEGCERDSFVTIYPILKGPFTLSDYYCKDNRFLDIGISLRNF